MVLSRAWLAAGGQAEVVVVVVEEVEEVGAEVCLAWGLVWACRAD